MRNSVLYFDLSTGDVKKENLSEATCDPLIGGTGVGWKLIADILSPDAKPLSKENVIVLSAGALVGTLAPGASKMGAIFKSPIIATKDGKHFVGESTSGGRHFAPMLRMAGHDHLVIMNQAEGPVYIEIQDDKVQKVDARDLWGLGADEAADRLFERYGDECGVITIGPAGEKKVFYSMAFVDKTNSLGRSGLGAVMGAKNLKAIVVVGTKGIDVEAPDEFFEAVQKVSDPILNWPEREHWINLGMGAGWSSFIHTQYVGKWSKKKWDELYGEPKRMETLDRVVGCNSCLLSCRVRWKIPDGEFAGEVGLGSPYGKSATSGQLLDIEDHRKTIHMVTLANAAGIDFYTTTRMMDFVTTLFQRGELTKEDTKGYELGREYDDYLELFDMIVHREGFGDVLADGWLGLYQKFRLDPQDYWYGGICKGTDFIYDGRSSNLHPMMMSFFTRPRPHHGGSHTMTNSPSNTLEQIREQVEGLGLEEEIIERIFTPAPYTGQFNVGRYTKYMEDWMRIKNALGFCSVYTFFGLMTGEEMADIFSKAVGKEFTAGELMERGERISNLAKLVNVREGFTRKEDKIPEVWLRPMETPEGRIEMQDYFKNISLTMDDVTKILDDYYLERGWSIEDGIPKEETLRRLNLDGEKTKH